MVIVTFFGNFHSHRSSLLCEMDQRLSQSHPVAAEVADSGGMKVVELPTEVLKETALSHQSETKV